MSTINKSVKNFRTLEGVVVSSAGQKTIVVRVDRATVHPKYGKRYVVSRRYQVHDEANKFKPGDKVSFVECRPLSRHKRWRVAGEYLKTS